jgi:Leucine-rich repeat (LRR) protein
MRILLLSCGIFGMLLYLSIPPLHAAAGVASRSTAFTASTAPKTCAAAARIGIANSRETASATPATALEATLQGIPSDSGQVQTDRSAELERMLAYWSSYLNTLGDPKVPMLDKDVIVRQSYGKLFRDSAVQIEDDLDPARAVPIQKPVQAYLQDVEFFFQSAAFEHELLSIEAQQTDEGQSSWRVKTLRRLRGVDFRGDSIDAVLTRYVEINEGPQGLKIVSVYHTTPDRKGALRAWWSSLSPAWRKAITDGVRITPELALADVQAYQKGLLFSDRDTFRLADLDAKLVPDSVVASARLPELDSLPFSSSNLDALLFGLQDRPFLDLSGAQFDDWRPLEAFRRIERLNLSGSNLEQSAPLRGMLRLRELDLSGTNIPDLLPLRFAQQLEVLHARYSGLSSPLPAFARLRDLDLQGCALDSAWRPPQAPALERLNLSGTRPDLSDWPSYPLLRVLDLSRCGISDLSVLGPMPGVEQLKLSGNPLVRLAPLDAWSGLQRLWVDSTKAASLRALSDLPALQRVDANATALERESVQALHRQRPQILVVYETESLQDWWSGLSRPWQLALSRAIGHNQATEPQASMPTTPAPPSEAMLHRITGLRHLDLRAVPLCPQMADCAPEDSLCLARGPACLTPLNRLDELEALYLGNAALPSTRASRHWEAVYGLEQLQILDLSGQALEDLSGLQALPNLKQLYVDSARGVDWTSLATLPHLEFVFADGAGIGDSLAGLLERNMPSSLLLWQSGRLQRTWDSLPEVWQNAIQQGVLDDALLLPSPPDQRNGTGGADPFSDWDYARFRLWERHRVGQLDLAGQSLEALSPLAFCPYLQALDVSDNRLNSLLPLRQVPLLQQLVVSDNPLFSLAGLASCSDLRYVDATNTPIADLDPVAALTRLEDIKVSGTDIRSLNALEGLRSLRVVHAANTNIRSLSPLESAELLEELSIFNTRISESKVARFREAHPDCRITHY